MTTLSLSKPVSAPSHKSIEKLIFLLDYSSGLLARLYHATQFECGEKLQSLPSDLRSMLSRNIADPTSGVWEIAGMEALQNENTKQDILNESKFVYDVFVDLCNTSEEIVTVVKHISRSVVCFNLRTNGDVCVCMFDLLSNFTKMHLLASKIDSNARFAVLVHSLIVKDEYCSCHALVFVLYFCAYFLHLMHV